MSDNNLVGFLRHYGPTTASDAMYDELIQSELEHYGINPPITIQPARLGTLLENFRSSAPSNVILTGTAGDGKTFHCRRVWEELGGSAQAWAEGQKVISLQLPAGRSLTIIKDLSELTDGEKQAIMPDLSAALQGREEGRVYLVAANDGQLLATWRQWAEPRGGADLNTFKRLEALLVEERVEDGALALQLYNLSRLDASETFEQLLDEVVEHPQWQDCAGCKLFSERGEASTCPIRINRERLRAGSTFRSRLLALLQLAAANRLHLPIRHLLLLISNILLGDSKPGSKGLITCQRARNRAQGDEYALTTPYANVFGRNLSESQRHQYQAFSVLESFGIGEETNNAIDSLLLYAPYADPDRYRALVDNDPYYGSRTYREHLEEYLEGQREDIRGFMKALEHQRQRLFFSLPEEEGMLSPWALTVYRNAGVFLRFCEALRHGDEASSARAALIRGLNRTFCGMMIDETNELYIGSSGGDGRGKIASLLHHKLPTQPCRRDVYADFELPSGERLPWLIIKDPMEQGQTVDALELQLTHFEYLMRVSQGSLPATFSQQCFEDFLDFKLRLIERLDGIFGQERFDGQRVQFQAMTVGRDGRVQDETIQIHTGS